MNMTTTKPLLSINPRESLWVEKYRPTNVQECILPARISDIFQSFVDSKSIPNLILSGSAGVGKTTVARALAAQLGYDVLFINASKDGNIDTLRTTITDFTTTVSLSGNGKVVILDEGDHLNPVSTQPALRSFIEQNSQHCRFIITCNYPSKIIDALHSRCQVVSFDIRKSDLAEIGVLAVDRFTRILQDQGLAEPDPQILRELIVQRFPDIRNMLITLQTYATSNGKIDIGILSKKSDGRIDALVDALRSKNFREVRVWVAENSTMDAADIFRKLYESLYGFLEPTSVPKAILTIADYLYRSAFVADQEINMTAALIEIMASCEFKDKR